MHVSLALTIALTFVNTSVPAPNPYPAVIARPCPGLAHTGCYYDNTIYGTSRFTLLHELGHAYDRANLSEGERNRFRTLTHRKGQPWIVRAANGTTDWTGGNESFADAYANCALRRIPGRGSWDVSSYYNPSRRMHRRVCAFIRRTR